MGIRRLAVFDFDGTLMDTPEKEKGVEKWKEETGQEWPHNGWWGRKESLDTSVFNIEPKHKVVQDYREKNNDPSTLTIMMTGRHEGLRDEVEGLLQQHGLEFDKYLLKKKHPTIEDKIGKLEGILEEYSGIEVVEIWEDRPEHVSQFEKWGEDKDVEVTVYKVD